LELLLWVRTRWASLYKCLDRVLELRMAIDQFVRNADASVEVPELRNKQYIGYKLSYSEWDKIVIIHEALREPANVTQTFSRERTPTVWRIIPTLEFLIKRWETMSTQPRYDEIKEALSAGVESLKKWFHRAETSSDAYFICLVLDPNIKDVYFKSRWSKEQYKKGIKGLEK
ncbi:ribonuclease H-like domain-containing protein, partial [Mycena pura]